MVPKRGMMQGQRAQITVFMIVGIILLFSSALLFYIRGQIVSGIPSEFIPTIEEVPLEAQPVKIFVEDCVQKIGKEAIKSIGLHSGYVAPSDPFLSGTAFMVGIEPTESDGITLFEDTKSMMPYWWYLKTGNRCSGNCLFDSLRPPLRKTEGRYSIEEQMDIYINRELPRCINDFVNFQQQGFDITALGDIETDTRVTERDISILVTYPIRTLREGRSTDMKSFFTKLDLAFKDVYDMATMISKKEADTAFLETHTMDAISMYSMPTSTERLPPIAEFTMNPNEFMIWTRTRTQEQLEQNVLPYVTSMMQVDQSRNFKRIIMFKKDASGALKYDPIGTALMDKTIVRLDKNFTDLEARFSYLDWWPIYLSINDREILMPTSISIPILSWLGLNQYVFLYSVAYPVMVTIKDPNAFAGEGYEFRFAVEENLRYNLPINVTNVTVFSNSSGTLVCSPNQKQSPPVTIEVKNKMTGGPVDDVRISVLFGKEECFVGVTDIEADNRSVITARLPVGLGEIKAVHFDYLDLSGRFASSPDIEQNITLELMPYRFINISVFARPLAYQSYKYVLPSTVPFSSLSPKERFLFVFERKDNDTNYGYKTYVQGVGSMLATLKMIPGKYEVKGYLILNNTIRVPAEDKTYGGGLFGSSTPIHINESIIDQWTEGGVLLDNETGYFTVTQEELFGSQRLNMYVLRFPLPLTHSTEFKNAPSLEQAAELKDYSNIYRTELEPEWVR
jgi:hypothetical protein